MDLFNKFESKYYSILEDFLNMDEEFKRKDIEKVLFENIADTTQNKKFLDEIAGGKKKEKNGTEEVIYSGIFDTEKINYKGTSKELERDGILHQRIGSGVPILMNNLEKKAIYSLANKKKAPYFLDKETIEKINELYKKDENISLWDENYIKIKNQSRNGDSEKAVENGKMMRDILKAIVDGKSILYKYNFKKLIEQEREIYPYKLEYSPANDKFRIIAYIDLEDRFIKLNLDKMEDLRIGDSKVGVDLDEKFNKFRKEKERTLVLSISQKYNNVERSFRIFSYYERTATYMKEDNLYILEIKYNENDTAELIRDIMSLGDGVMVLEPIEMRERIIERIRKCVDNYK